MQLHEPLPPPSARSLRRVRKEVVSPHDALRLLKQPRGDTRSAVRSADYMRETVRLVEERMHHGHKRSLNATGQTRAPVARRERELQFHRVCPVSPDLLSREDLERLAEITGCAARVQQPQCFTRPNINKFRTITSVCNNL